MLLYAGCQLTRIQLLDRGLVIACKVLPEREMGRAMRAGWGREFRDAGRIGADAAIRADASNQASAHS
jgi:hypothetical protein